MHREEAKPVSSFRLRLELHRAEASVQAVAWRPEASVHFAALDHPEASRREEPHRLSSCHLPEVCLPEALGHLVVPRLAVLARREFAREKVRRPKGSRAWAWHRVQQASCLLGIRDQIYLASLYDERLNGLRSSVRAKLAR